jgi:hypothetical protein
VIQRRGADASSSGSGRLSGRTIAVAHHDGFVAGYIARALEAQGAEVVGVLGCLSDARAWLLAPEARVTSACVGSLLYDAGSAGLLAGWQTRFLALLFVGTEEPPLLSIPATALCYPFASYQIVDAMAVMFERILPPAVNRRPSETIGDG